jgi:hypothetical protein
MRHRAARKQSRVSPLIAALREHRTSRLFEFLFEIIGTPRGAAAIFGSAASASVLDWHGSS